MEGRFHLNSSPFSITLNFLSVAEASDTEFAVESLLETFHNEEGEFLFLFHLERFFFLLFLSISSKSELEDVLCLLFFDFFLFEYFPLWRRFFIFCFTCNLLRWLFRRVSSFNTFFRPVSLTTVHYRGNKVWLMMIFLFGIIIWIILLHSRGTFKAFLKLFPEYQRQELDRLLYKQSRKRVENWPPRWYERVGIGNHSIRSTEILWNKIMAGKFKSSKIFSKQKRIKWGLLINRPRVHMAIPLKILIR